MTPAREAEIRAQVRAQILYHLEQDLEGGEAIMKEVWEDTHAEGEHAIAEDELARIIALIKEQP